MPGLSRSLRERCSAESIRWVRLSPGLVPRSQVGNAVFGRKQSQDRLYTENDAYSENEGNFPIVRNPSGEPMTPYTGRAPNPHIAYGQADLTNAPTTFNRFGTRWGDVQLKNGLANGVASGKRWGYRGSG